MATHDLGHTLTDKKLRDLERRIARLYAQAGRELQETIDAYFEQFAKRDEEMRALIGEIVNGKEWTEQDYKQWRLAQIGRGERYQALRERIAQRMTNANDVAISYINDETPGIYSLNRNYAAYTIEQVAGNVGFDLWDEQTARRLIVEQPELMPNYPPARALRRGIDLAYGRRQITASVTSSILQGRSLRGIADDLQQRITTMDRTSAIRTARTAFTGAQNAGRMDSYAAAEKMGIKLKKEWLATLDGRTRHSHAALDGEKVGTDEKFSNGCRFPGDPQGRPGEVYNCRCTMVAALDDVDTSDALRRTRDGLIPDMTYAQWEASKRGYAGRQISPIRTEEMDSWRKSLQNKENRAILKAKIESGEISTKIRHQQQAKHIAGTPQFEQYRASRLAKGKTPQSILTLSTDQAQNAIERYKCTGTVQITRAGTKSVKIVEFCSTETVVGRYFDNGGYYDTKRIGIYYSRFGAHIVPVKEKFNG